MSAPHSEFECGPGTGTSLIVEAIERIEACPKFPRDAIAPAHVLLYRLSRADLTEAVRAVPELELVAIEKIDVNMGAGEATDCFADLYWPI